MQIIANFVAIGYIFHIFHHNFFYNSIEIKALLEQAEEKKKGDFLSIAATNDNTCMEFCVEIPKKVSKKVNAEMFEKMTAIYAKRKTPINIKVNFATDNC